MTAKPIPAVSDGLPDSAIAKIEIICSEPSSIVQVQRLGENHAIAAEGVREILAEAKSHGREKPAPAGPAVARIRGAWIQGALDLDAIAQDAGGLYLAGCKLDQPVTLRDAALSWLVIEQCVLPGVQADRATVGTLTVADSLVTGNYPGGTIRLDGARVAGDPAAGPHPCRQSGRPGDPGDGPDSRRRAVHGSRRCPGHRSGRCGMPHQSHGERRPDHARRPADRQVRSRLQRPEHDRQGRRPARSGLRRHWYRRTRSGLPHRR